MARAASSRRWKLMKAKPWGRKQVERSGWGLTPVPGTPRKKGLWDSAWHGLVLPPRPHLGLPRGLVLGQVDPGDGAEGAEQLLQVGLPCVLRQVGDPDGGVVIGWGEGGRSGQPAGWGCQSPGDHRLGKRGTVRHESHAPCRRCRRPHCTWGNRGTGLGKDAAELGVGSLSPGCPPS